MSADAEAIDLMVLIVQAQNGFLVDVIARHNRELTEPRKRQFVCDFPESVPCPIGQIGQIARVEPDPDRFVAEVTQSDGNGAEIQQTTPVCNKVQ